jgi:molecular chaperone GrpE
MSDDTIKSAAELAAERAEQVQAQQAAEASDAETLSSTGDAAAASEPTVAELQQRIASLNEELEAAKDKAVRLVAEFDNFRKRSAREYADMLDSAQGKAFSALYPVIDNLERAFQDAPAEGDWTPADPAGFAKGIRLVLGQIRKAISDAGLEEIESLGQPFDPNLHDALTQMPHPEIPENHVAAIHARGWKKGERILRHAQVIVSAGPAA